MLEAILSALPIILIVLAVAVVILLGSFTHLTVPTC